MLLPEQIAGATGAIVTTGGGVTVMVILVVSLHPLELEPTTTYVCVLIELSITLVPVVALRPVAGLHV